MSEMTSASKRSIGPTGSDTGWPLMTITLPIPRSPNRGGLSARNAPYRMRNVSAAKAVKTKAWILRDFQKTSA